VNGKVLLIDGDLRDRNAAAAWLVEAGYDVQTVRDGASGEELGLSGDFDVVVAEYRLEGVGGLELIASLHQRQPRLPVVLTARGGGSQTAIGAIKNGAFDYLPKPLDQKEFLSVVDQAVQAHHRMSKPVEIVADVHKEQDTLIGRGRSMTRVYKDLARISPTPATVLIRGETGTGKELIARAIYQHGHRAHRPFITVNCAAIPENLLESELFGHERGAFTGATSLRVGKFEQAHNATLFLDEIGDMDLHLQSKLLRVLQERSIQRLGGKSDIPVDVRVIAATHQKLEAMIAAGEFREDLFYRLNVASIVIPSLNERREDIPLLIEYFLGRFGSEYGIDSPAITKDATQLLVRHPWPGNVRQLQNVVRKALLLCRGYAIGEGDIRALLRQADPDTSSRSDSEYSATVSNELTDGLGMNQFARELIDQASRDTPAEGEGDAYLRMVSEAERALLSEAIRRAEGNQARAARWLGISRFTLRQKLKTYGLHPKV